MRFSRHLTLQDLCLEVIIEHLDIFIRNRCRIPQKHIDFLFRQYSEKCFREYTNSHSKTEECLLWFLNPHNKKVFLPRITEDIMKKLQTVGPVITSLTLRSTMATENVLNAIICLVPHLLYLDLSHTNCSDKTLLCIERMCSDLVTLNLEDCEDVTNDGMLNLCGNNLSLKKLNIFLSSVEHDGLYNILKGMPSLQCLIYENMADSICYVHENEIQDCIVKNIKYNLTELVYENVALVVNPQKVIQMWTVLCPKVEKVHILFPVTHDVLKLCSSFPHLKELRLRMRYSYFDTFLQDPLNPFLPVANNLSTLILSSVEIPSVTLIECFKNVKKLHLKRVSFTPFSEEEIKLKDTKLDALSIKDLCLDKATNTYKFISFLISLSKNVTKLSLSHLTNLPNELIDIILNSMKNLIVVEFSFIASILPPSFRNIFFIPSVQEVHLDSIFGQNCQPVHVGHQPNTSLLWSVMNTICDDDDDDDEGFENNVLSDY